jgi:hypothetical protein
MTQRANLWATELTGELNLLAVAGFASRAPIGRSG